METLTSGARCTIACLRSLCDLVGLPVAEYMVRLVQGFARYGCDNHLTMPLEQEWLPEILDVTVFPAVGVSQGRVSPENPHLLTYMERARNLMQDYRDILAWEAEQDRGAEA